MKIKVYLANTMFTNKTKKMVESLGFKTRKAHKDELYPDEAYYSYVLDGSPYKNIEINTSMEKFVKFLKKYQAKLSDNTFVLYT